MDFTVNNLLLVILVLAIEGGLGNDGSLYSKVVVSYTTVTNQNRQSSSYYTGVATTERQRTMSCLLACSDTLWCNLVCKHPTSATTCLLFNIYLVAGYVETDLGDAINCYTTKIRDYAVGADVEGDLGFSSTAKENMVDGIFRYNTYGDCYWSRDLYNPYFKLDLLEVKSVQRIFFVMLPHNDAAYYYDFEVRVGLEDLPEERFDEYTLWGFHPAPSANGQEVTFSVDEPVPVRYVVFRRMSHSSCNSAGTTNSPVCHLRICHIEIN